MQLFLVKILFLIFFILSTLYFGIQYFTKGYVDEFYNRFTVTSQPNLIIGSSRAAQGINPQWVFKSKGLNFSFTHSISPYGEVYSSAIDKILIPGKGIVISEVCPMMFSDESNIENKFREKTKMLDNMGWYGLKPNFEYILSHYKKPLYKLILNGNQSDDNLSLHDNGWLEVKNNTPKKYQAKKNKNIRYFTNIFKKQNHSNIRLNSYLNLIHKLQSQGKKIIMVRLPLVPELLKIENTYWVDFNKQMDSLAKKCGILYIDYSADTNYHTHDGSHLDKNSAEKMSKALAQIISNSNPLPIP